MKISSHISAAMALAMAFPFATLAERTIRGSYTLTANEDWTADGLITLDSATIDLAGYTLKVYGLTGTGQITSTQTEVETLATSEGLSAENRFIYATTNGVLTRMAGADTSGTSDGSKYPPEYAFDGKTSTFTLGLTDGWNLSFPLELNYKFSEPTIINCYKIYSVENANILTGLPKEWTLEGSNDGVVWQELDRRQNEVFENSSWRSFACNNETPYLYYRLKVTATGNKGRFNLGELVLGCLANKLQFDIAGLAASDLSKIAFDDAVKVLAEMGKDESVALTADLDLSGMAATINGTIDLAGHTLTVNSLSGSGTITGSKFRDLTTANGLSAENKFIWASVNGSEVVLAGANGNGNDGSKYPAERAFDDIYGDEKIAITESGEKNYSFLYYAIENTFWRDGNTFEVNYRFEVPTPINHYRIYPYTSAGTPGYPKAWTFEGSNDGAVWIELDSRSNQSLSKGVWSDYETVKVAPYQYYRLKISLTDSSARIDIGELEFGYNHTAPGEVVVTVPAGETAENTEVTLDGYVRLIKDDKGTFVASKADQTYSGGTDVRDGVLKQGAAVSGLFGEEGAEICVEKGGFFDVAGEKNSVGHYCFLLRGGCLESSVAVSTSSAYQSIRNIVLERDSSFDSAPSLYIGSGANPGSVDLGGHTLSATIGEGQYLRIDSGQMRNGLFDVAAMGTGTLIIRGSRGVEAKTVDVRLNSPLLIANGSSFSVRGYEALWRGDNGAQNGQLFVYGAFKPVTDYWYGCTLMDGATLDLSSRSTALGAVSLAAGGQTTLAFEENATVTVKLGTKRFENSKVLAWTRETKPANIDTVKFVCDAADSRRSFFVKDDGLYAAMGFVICIY